MALMRCGECGKDMSSAANSCPNCGAPNRLTAYVGLIKAIPAIGFLFAMIFFGVKCSMDSSIEDKRRQAAAAIDAVNEEKRLASRTPEQMQQEKIAKDSETAVAICRQGSKQFFKNPDSVSFPQLARDIPVKANHDGTFVVRFLASATNSFNAKTQSTYQCKTKPVADGSNWTIISLKEIN